jgi:hypothetical protein
MSDDDALIAAEAAEDYKRQVQQARTVRVQASDLMAAFGITDMGQEARESVADALWEAGVCAEPSLASERIDASTKIKLALGVDPGSVMGQLGHTDPGFTLRVYRHGMRRDRAAQEYLRVLVGGADWRPPPSFSSGSPSTASHWPSISAPTRAEAARTAAT